MVSGLKAVLGVVVLAGFWWTLFLLLRLLQPSAAERAPRQGDVVPSRSQSPGPATKPISWPQGEPQGSRCCLDCTPGCQTAGLAIGQVWGRGDDWWGQPFGDAGPNSEAMTFWGDECCQDCADCPICQGL